MTTLNAAQVKQIAKELKVKNWWNKKRADLITEIADLKGWTGETPETVEYLLGGGEIKQLPYGPEVKPEIRHQESAGQARKKPTKVTKKTADKAEKKTAKKVTDENTVTLAGICLELGVEGRIARRKLRTSDITKPGKQWEWELGNADIDKVKTLLGTK